MVLEWCKALFAATMLVAQDVGAMGHEVHFSFDLWAGNAPGTAVH